MENQEGELLEPTFKSLFREAHSTKRRIRRSREEYGTRFQEYQNGEIHNAKPHINYERDFVNYDLIKTPLYGYELEVQACPSRLRPTLNTLWQKHLGVGEFYFCMDGSLNDIGNGVEIVSKAKSEAEIKEKYVQYFNLLKATAKLGVRSHDTQKCGLHVHVSKMSLPEAKWEDVRAFVCNNKDFFLEVSRRQDCYFCEFKNDNNARYRAINLQNSHTAEFRFFRGTLLGSSFLASLECCFSLVNYFREMDDHKSPRMDDYKRFVAERYKIFQNYIADRGLTKTGLTTAQKIAYEQKEVERKKRQEELEKQEWARLLLSEINVFFMERRYFKPCSSNPYTMHGAYTNIAVSADGRCKDSEYCDAWKRITIMAELKREGDWEDFGDTEGFFETIPVQYYTPKLYGNWDAEFDDEKKVYVTSGNWDADEHALGRGFSVPKIVVTLRRELSDGELKRGVAISGAVKITRRGF